MPASAEPTVSPSSTLPFQATIKVRDTCLCLHVQRAARALARHFDAVLKPFGLTHGQFSLLMSLNRPAPARMRDVSSLLAMDRTTLTANLKPLQRRGLMAIAADPEDRRGHLLSLTAAGHAVLIAALPAWEEAHAALERDLTGDPHALRADLKVLSGL